MHIFIISIPQRLSSRTPLLFWKKWMRDLYFSASRPFFIPHRRPCFSNGSHHAVPRLSLLRRRGYSPAKLENHAKCVVGCLFIKKIPPEFTPQGEEAERFLGKYVIFLLRHLLSWCWSNYSEDSTYDEPGQTDDSKTDSSLFKDLESFLILSFITGSRHHIESASKQNN